MRILLTGASGFVGRSVLQFLEAGGHEILTITRFASRIPKEAAPKTRTIIGDLSCPSTVEPEIVSFKPEVCIHAAWNGIPDYSELMSQTNLVMSTNLFSLVVRRTACRKLIGLGSCLEYNTQQGACKEAETSQPGSYFSWAKQAISSFCAILCQEQQREFFWFRVFYVYGPGQRAGALIPSLIRQFSKGQKPSLSHPRNVNDFIYVSDVADAISKAAIRPLTPGTYNVGSGVPRSILDVCAAVESEVCGDMRITEGLRSQQNSGARTNFWADITKTQACLGWTPRISLSEGIRNLRTALNEENK